MLIDATRATWEHVLIFLIIIIISDVTSPYLVLWLISILCTPPSLFL